MERNRTIHIDMNRACSECGKKGATQNGLCLTCIRKRIPGGSSVEFTGMIDGTKTKVKIEKRDGGAETRRTFMELKVILPYSADTAAMIECHQCEALRFSIEQSQEELDI